MKIGILIIVVFAIYVINNIVLIKLKSRYGENEFSKKMLDNSKNIISCIVGIIFMVISIELFDFIKWPIIIFYSFAFAYEFIVAFVISFILQMYLILKKEFIEKESWYALFSNLIASLCYGFMVYSIFKLLF